MSSMARSSELERFIEAFGDKLEQKFQYLVGSTIVKMDNKEVGYHVKADITLKKEGEFEEAFEVHHRWGTETESYTGKEEEDYTMELFYQDYLEGKTIQKVYIGTSDRDDEVYLLAQFAEYSNIQIPVGFDPEYGEFKRFSDDLLTTEEKEQFLKIE